MSFSIDASRTACVAAVCLATALTSNLSVASEATPLPDLRVVAEREYAATAASVGDDLRSRRGVHVLSQGYAGGQNDLSIRGSSFSGAGLAIDGLALQNPQTEHFNAELPLPTALFHAPEILTGMGQSRRTSGNLVGTIDYRFRDAAAGGYLDLLIGERARDRQSFLYDIPLIVSADAPLGVHTAVFGGRESARGLDYGDNDLDRHFFGLRVQADTEISKSNVVFAHQDKEFGARGYYGVSPDFQAEERIEDTLALFSTRVNVGRESELNIGTHWREIKDDYRLHLPTGLFRNQHRSTISGASVSGAASMHSSIGLDWLADFADENIDSTALGDHRRDSSGVTILPRLDFERVGLAAGGRYADFSDYASEFLPLAELGFTLSDDLRLYFIYTETTRQPSYTELNYESPGSLGNAGLGRQNSASIEMGLRAQLSSSTDLSLAGFRRRSSNTVDWIKDSPAERWVASDLGLVETHGIEAVLGMLMFQERLFVELQYGYLDKSNEGEFYASRYALDYARHRANIVGGCNLSQALSVAFRQELRWQTTNEARGGDDLGYDGSFEIAWTPERLSATRLSVGVDNIWNDSFEPMPGLRAQSRAFHIGARIGF